MTAFPSYSTGTVSIGVNATSVVGVGTSWISVNTRPGDRLVVAGHEVTISDVVDATHLTIDAWPYSAVIAGTAYKIYQDSPLRFAGSQAAIDNSTLIAGLNSLGPIFNVDTADTVPDPSYGEDGQYAHQMSSNTWWIKTAGAWVVSRAPSFQGALKPYLGQVATRCFANRKFSTTYKQRMSRSRHRAAEALGSFQIVIPNWHVDFNIGGVFGETATGGTGVVSASVEYPAGTFTQIKFSGVATGNILSGSDLISDVVKVKIPENAFFFIRMFYTNTAGIPYNYYGGDDANGEAMTYAVSGLTDQTMSDTVIQTTAGYHSGPSAIIAMTQKPTIAVIGASNAYGHNDTHDDTTGDLGPISRSVGPSLAYINLSIAGDLAAYFIGYTNTARIALAAYCSHIVFGLGRNDMNFGSGSHSGVQTLADLRTLWALFPNQYKYQCTLEPTSTSTDGWVTTVNQTTASSNAERIYLNDQIRLVPSPLTNFVEVADWYETIRDSGIWIANYTTDGVHGNAASNVVVRDSRSIDPAIITNSAVSISGATQRALDLKATKLAPILSGLVQFKTIAGVLSGTINDSGKVSFGPNAPIVTTPPLLDLNSNSSAIVNPDANPSQLRLLAADGSNCNMNFMASGTGVGCNMSFFVSTGTAAVPLAIASGIFLVTHRLMPYDGIAYGNSGGANALTAFKSTQAWSAGNHGAEWVVELSPNSSATRARVLSAYNSGCVGVGTGVDRGIGNLSIQGTLFLGIYTVATLPTGVVAGNTAYASNLRVFNPATGVQQGVGAGTGGHVGFNGTSWTIIGNNSTAVA